MLLTKIVKLLEDDDINWVELSRQTKEVEVRFLTDKPEPNHVAIDASNGESRSFVKPGASIMLENGVDFSELSTTETAEALSRNTSSRGILTAICDNSRRNQGANSFALTCFHVGYNSKNDQVRLGLPTIEGFRDKFKIFQDEARRPCKRQKETKYHYQPQNRDCRSYDVETFNLGLFDKDRDLLLIHIGKDVKFMCAVEKYSGEWGLTWYKKKLGRKRKKKDRKNQAKQDEVVKIGSRGIRLGKMSSNLHAEGKNDHLFEDFYVVRSTDPCQSFLDDGDSGSLVCMGNDGKYSPFAYGVCETDLGKDQTKVILVYALI